MNFANGGFERGWSGSFSTSKVFFSESSQGHPVVSQLQPKHPLKNKFHLITRAQLPRSHEVYKYLDVLLNVPIAISAILLKLLLFRQLHPSKYVIVLLPYCNAFPRCHPDWTEPFRVIVTVPNKLSQQCETLFLATYGNLCSTTTSASHIYNFISIPGNTKSLINRGYCITWERFWLRCGDILNATIHHIMYRRTPGPSVLPHFGNTDLMLFSLSNYKTL